MSDVGGLESFTPGEGGSGVSEELSEEAKQRFAAAGAVLQQIYREERKAKRRDRSVVDIILQFLNDDQRAHLSTLVVQLCAKNCPSPFLLAILSLISEPCLVVLQEYLREADEKALDGNVALETALTAYQSLDQETNRTLIEWITRLQIVLFIENTEILSSIRQTDGTLDLSLLQLTTFVIQEFFSIKGKQAEYERARQFTASILQMLFEPFLTDLHERP
ncbi:hypothetical protein A3H22_00445 [Candidatus Peribacteria bacterium RIFCSPLOWO2_12_FULL_55_15]|nr:MAG: hypothetical protein A2789_02550 [Candidatus Peribacteria bacterium RIFCSPHIGHO2_01_FULL_54_22]OGJ62516.1 MAG: hypothetical protein A3D12_02280 [Candidatus Peribacteria bacterium RIFCSPHIGHO2_02_FULL_55_24]OGJ67439.1 MAG: hypothetical protein A2947_01620 [Candidatus Peribacteria bacterium RIFCSPLOWO2_01_FULL_54_110]OGJ69718.1 MAG: hypothetical protein A3H90_01460 [Candidatus Peribacteria bacterium RIFCSPLOWO2_02_FULL_55_36]OGJ70358.1 MAG: hypothetical protein A3H22_00445 [Candidatus Per